MFCNRTKEFLRKHNIAFGDRDITQDESAFAELEQLGVMTTPVVVVALCVPSSRTSPVSTVSPRPLSSLTPTAIQSP